ncbi:MAG: hypothetical protein HKN25_04560 [Pyrinomonadaceae bacterium]|nr:hypothetical protein [Pyrinomonadaceae bacterium]
MFFTKMPEFCKNSDCPSSEDLLNFQKGKSPAASSERIHEHNRTCDFCSAEVEFYSHFQFPDEKISETEIPSPLYELAESLLNNKDRGSYLLNKLLIENEGLTLKKA